VSDPKEPSYYEIALTNRQVLVAFVLVLGCVLAAFLSGVWVGRKGFESGRLERAADGAEAAGQEPAELAQLEELRFFSDQREAAADGTDKPDLRELLTEPDRRTTLAQDVGSETPRPKAGPPPPAPAPPPTAPPPAKASASEPPEPAAPPPATKPAKPPASTATPPAAGAEDDEFIVQVFSSREEAQARKVLAELVADDLRAFLSPVEVEGQTMFRVRIGPYHQREKADLAAQRVNRKYKLDTWVTAAGN